MSLSEGTAKMSKSSPDDFSRINLLDSPDIIAQKVKRAKTDMFDGLELDNPDRPEATNLLTIYQLATGMTKEAVAAECSGLRWGQFKPMLSEALIAHLSPLQTRYNEVMADPAMLDRILLKGADQAAESANRTLANAYQAMGYYPRPKI